MHARLFIMFIYNVLSLPVYMYKMLNLMNCLFFQVYIFQGNLHIIPFPQSPAQITTLPSGVPEIQYAVKCVRNYNTATLASTEINNAVKQRFDG